MVVDKMAMVTSSKQIAVSEETYVRLFVRKCDRSKQEMRSLTFDEIIKELLDDIEPATAD